MRRFLFSFVLTVTYLTCFSQVIIGKKVEEVSNLTILDSAITLLVEPAQMSDVQICRINSIYYEILLDRDRRVKFISTSDTLFKSAEGIKIGTTYGMLVKKFNLKKKKIVKFPGWGNVLELKSGWLAVFDFAKPAQSDSPIIFFYQRK